MERTARDKKYSVSPMPISIGLNDGAPDSWFSHLAIEVPGEQTSNEWLEAVDDAQYGVLK